MELQDESNEARRERGYQEALREGDPQPPEQAQQEQDKQLDEGVENPG